MTALQRGTTTEWLLDYELRETSRWAAGAALQIGPLLDDEFDLSQLFQDRAARRHYCKHLKTEISVLVSLATNFDFAAGVPDDALDNIVSVGAFIDLIMRHLRPKAVIDLRKVAATLPPENCEADDTWIAVL